MTKQKRHVVLSYQHSTTHKLDKVKHLDLLLKHFLYLLYSAFMHACFEFTSIFILFKFFRVIKLTNSDIIKTNKLITVDISAKVLISKGLISDCNYNQNCI